MAEILNGYIIQILHVIVLAVAALIAQGLKKLYDKYVSTDIKQKVVRTVVRAVEQIYTDLHGKDKLDMAISRATYILESEYGIKIGDYELESLIEAAVNEFNNTFHKADQPPDEESKWEKPFTEEDTESYGMTD